MTMQLNYGGNTGAGRICKLLLKLQAKLSRELAFQILSVYVRG
jgi:hypothetical protein